MYKMLSLSLRPAALINRLDWTTQTGKFRKLNGIVCARSDMVNLLTTRDVSLWHIRLKLACSIWLKLQASLFSMKFHTF